MSCCVTSVLQKSERAAEVLRNAGIVVTPLAPDELAGPGAGYRRMIEVCPVGRAGTPDEGATLAPLLMGADGAFITEGDFPMDGGVTCAYWCGAWAPGVQNPSN
jgi:hypothetical protein